MFPGDSVTTVMLPPASLRATLFAVAAVAVSSFVTYLFVEEGVPEVPTRASFSPWVGTRGSFVPTTIGSVGATAATESLEIPYTVSVAFGEPAIAVSSTYFLVANCSSSTGGGVAVSIRG